MDDKLFYLLFLGMWFLFLTGVMHYAHKSEGKDD